VAALCLSRVEKRLGQLVRLPLSGAPRPHLARGLRVVFEEKLAIYYLPRPTGIIVVRVLHGSRDLGSIEDEGGFSL
jgi:plasmid stabilization system protein ParE